MPHYSEKCFQLETILERRTARALSGALPETPDRQRASCGTALAAAPERRRMSSRAQRRSLQPLQHWHCPESRLRPGPAPARRLRPGPAPAWRLRPRGAHLRGGARRGPRSGRRPLAARGGGCERHRPRAAGGGAMLFVVPAPRRGGPRAGAERSMPRAECGGTAVQVSPGPPPPGPLLPLAGIPVLRGISRNRRGSGTRGCPWGADFSRQRRAGRSKWQPRPRAPCVPPRPGPSAGGGDFAAMGLVPPPAETRH